jgi:hypothetical protein
MFDINGDSTMARWKRSGDKVTDIRNDGIVTNSGRGNRRVGTDGHIHSSSDRWFRRLCVLDRRRLLVGSFVGLEMNVRRSCGFGRGSFSFSFGGGKFLGGSHDEG